MLPGFSDSVLSAQSAFRAVMDAFARPGRVVTLKADAAAPAPLMKGTAAVALTLFDHDSPVWIDADDPETAAAWLGFHTGAAVCEDPSACTFAIVTDSARLPHLGQFNPGTADYPDRAATVTVQVETLRGGRPLHLAGPGIRDRETIAPGPLPGDFAQRLYANRALFPCGVDLLLISGRDVVALPRSVRVMPEV